MSFGVLSVYLCWSFILLLSVGSNLKLVLIVLEDDHVHIMLFTKNNPTIRLV